jgi:hypothetical protein
LGKVRAPVPTIRLKIYTKAVWNNNNDILFCITNQIGEGFNKFSWWSAKHIV